MWAFLRLRLRSLVLIALVLPLARVALRATSRWLERRHGSPTSGSSVLAWAGDTLPGPGRRRQVGR